MTENLKPANQQEVDDEEALIDVAGQIVRKDTKPRKRKASRKKSSKNRPVSRR